MPHRMACARCDLYPPKEETRAQLLEARGNLQRILAQIPLTDEERAAVEDGATAVNQLSVCMTCRHRQGQLQGIWRKRAWSRLQH
jgi:hypothetical protein